MAVVALSKQLDDITRERDAALISKEDVLAQLRVAKRRVKEAEDEQYKAEEDAANLRAEIQALQSAELGANYASSTFLPDQQEMESLKSELEETWQRLQQEQLKLATEHSRNKLLTSKLTELETSKQAAEQALVELQNKQLEQDATAPDATAPASTTVPLSEEASSIDDTGTSMPRNSKHEEQLHELASMVERMEKGRQKLLVEIDAQSQEIERLFVENANLTSSVQEVTESARQWEEQVEQILEHNAQLRSDLSRMRMEQAMKSGLDHDIAVDRAMPDSETGETILEALRTENSQLKVSLAEMQSREVEQTAQVAQLTANLNRAILSSNSLGRIYRPVLSNIENRLQQLKQHVTIADADIY